MEHLKRFNEKICKTKEEVVEEYNKKYNSKFFKEFIKIFKSNYDLTECELDDLCDEYADEIHNEEEESGETMTDDEIIDNYWYSELEIDIIKRSVNSKYPGNNIWIEFFNSLMESDWKVKKKKKSNKK